MTRKEKKTLRKLQSTRQLMGIQRITSHGVVTKTDELVFFVVRPDNLSILSADAILGRIKSLTDLFRSEPNAELMALNSRASFQPNKRYYQQRIEAESNPALRELLRRDMEHLDEIQAASASSREFVLALRMDGKAAADEGGLRQLEKSLCEHGIYVHLAEEQDVKRLLAVYYQRDVTTEHFYDIDGEEYICNV